MSDHALKIQEVLGVTPPVYYWKYNKFVYRFRDGRAEVFSSAGWLWCWLMYDRKAATAFNDYLRKLLHEGEPPKNEASPFTRAFVKSVLAATTTPPEGYD